MFGVTSEFLLDSVHSCMYVYDLIIPNGKNRHLGASELLFYLVLFHFILFFLF